MFLFNTSRDRFLLRREGAKNIMSHALTMQDLTSDRRSIVPVELKVCRFLGVEGIPAHYTHLLDDASRRDFFLGLPWFINFERTIVSDGESVTVYGIESTDGSNHAFGAFPMWNRASDGILKPRVLQNLANYYTPHCGPILNEAHSTECIQAFAHALSEDRRLFAAIDLRCLDPNGPTFLALVRALSDVGLAVQTYFQFGNWYLDLAGRSYAEYFSSLPTVLKKNVPYQTRRLERTYRVELKLITGPEGLAQALSDYELVYHTSWREQEAYPGFIRGLADTALNSGSLRLGLLYADGVPVAAQFWLVHGRIASIYKIAYIESFSKFSVGTILTAHMMRHVIDVDKVTIVDYLSGDDHYKRDWMSHRRERWGIMAFNLRCLSGLALAARHLGGRRLNDIFRKVKARVAGKFFPGEASVG